MVILCFFGCLKSGDIRQGLRVSYSCGAGPGLFWKFGRMNPSRSFPCLHSGEVVNDILFRIYVEVVISDCNLRV